MLHHYVKYGVAEVAKALIFKNAKYLYNVTLCFQVIMYVKTARNEYFEKSRYVDIFLKNNTLRRRNKCESHCNV